MKLQVIQLEPYDDIVSVRDRLSFVGAERVLLVWPASGAILRRKLDLVIIQREAARCGLRLALVTHDRVVVEHADDLNISVFSSVDAGSKVRWKRPSSKVFVDRSTKPTNELDRYELMEAASRLKVQTPRQRTTQRTVRAVAAVILVATLLAGALIVLPAASVRIFMARDQLTTTVRLIADPTIAIENVATGHVPATLVSSIIVQRQATIPTTGSADIPASVATGTVIFTNLSSDPITVPAGTIVSTLNGAHPAKFHTLTDYVVPAKDTAEVTIEALPDSAGPVGNIEPNLITNVEGPLAKALSVRNANPTHGGTIRQQGIVTKEDQTRLLELVRDQIRTTSIAEIALTPTQFIAPGSIQIAEEHEEWTTFSAFVGDKADTLTLTLKVRIQALVIDELAARKAAYASLARLLQNRQIVVDSVTYQRGRVDPVDTKGQAAFLLTASADAVTSVDPEQIRGRLAGISVGDARALLERTLLLDPRRPPQIDVLPGIFGRLPFLPVRIEVIVQ